VCIVLLSVPDAIPENELIEIRRLLSDATDETVAQAAETVIARLRADPVLELSVIPHRMVHLGADDDGGGPPATAAALRNLDSMIRIDVVAAVFLSDPTTYEGGELTIDCGDGPEEVEQSAGGCVAFPASARVGVAPVTRGRRLGLHVGIESCVPDLARREVLYDVRSALQLVELFHLDNPGVRELRFCSDELMRMWLRT
jgi:PKHD-type hydroxylase